MEEFENESSAIDDKMIYFKGQNDARKNLQNLAQSVRSETQEDRMDLDGFFNEFYIISVDKAQCQKLKDIGEVQSLQPKVNYFFTPEADKNYDDQKRVVPSFVFPFGVEVKKCEKTESNSELNQFIFKSHNIELYKNCFVFTLKTEESYSQDRSRAVGP